MEPLSRVEFEQLPADEQNKHVEETLAALRESIPHGGAAVGAFLDVRFHVQELAEWAPVEVEQLWPFYRPGIERNASEIHAAFREALESSSLSPPHALYAKNCLIAAERLVNVADEYI